jgi:HK97 family phage prohead protease
MSALAHPTRKLTPAEPETRTFGVVEFRVLGDADQPGTFEAIVAVFGNIDSYGDRMVSGAFTRTLKDRGFPAVVWSHDWYTPPVGASLEAREVDGKEADSIAGRALDIEGGLYIKGRLLVDIANGEDHQIARQVWAAMSAKGGDGRPPLREFSFGFKTRKAQWVQDDVEDLPPDAQWTGGEIRELLDVDLFEVGPCLIGANPATELLAAKAAIVKRRDAGDVAGARELRHQLVEPEAQVKNAPPTAGRPVLPDEVRARMDQLASLAPPTLL